MFTGIIEGQGHIRTIRPAGGGKRISIEAGFALDNTKIGDSIAVNGACLTAVSLNGRRFDADISPETVSATTLGKARIGDSVNLERALRIADRLDGHMVSGHVDGIGTLSDSSTSANALILTFRVPEWMAGYMIRKGSVAVDGISLTINDCGKDYFTVSIIPHTAEITTLKRLAVGEAVNIETDLIGKYVKRFLSGNREDSTEETIPSGGIDRAFLARNGFI